MCKVEICDRLAKTRGYCQAHYKRVLKHGHPQADIPIREVEGDGYLHHGYRVVPVPDRLRHLSDGKPSMAEHRPVMAKSLGRPLRGDENVHHINATSSTTASKTLSFGPLLNPAGNASTISSSPLKLSWSATEKSSDCYPDSLG